MLQMEHRPCMCQACTLPLSYISSIVPFTAVTGYDSTSEQKLPDLSSCVSRYCYHPKFCLAFDISKRVSVLSLCSAQCLVVFRHRVQKKIKITEVG